MPAIHRSAGPQHQPAARVLSPRPARQRTRRIPRAPGCPAPEAGIRPGWPPLVAACLTLPVVLELHVRLEAVAREVIIQRVGSFLLRSQRHAGTPASNPGPFARSRYLIALPRAHPVRGSRAGQLVPARGAETSRHPWRPDRHASTRTDRHAPPSRHRSGIPQREPPGDTVRLFSYPGVPRAGGLNPMTWLAGDTLPGRACQHAGMRQEPVSVPCPRCRLTSPAPQPADHVWDRPASAARRRAWPQ
jgi:hypothetical protein